MAPRPARRPRPQRHAAAGRSQGAARRNTELGLLVMVVLITAGAYVLASLGQDANMPPNIGPFLLVLLALLLAANLVTRRFAPDADPMLLPLAGLLNGIGYVMIVRLNEDLAGRQSMWSAIGLGAFLFTLVVVKRARDLAAYRYIWMLVGIGLLALPMLPVIGTDRGLGSRIWVKAGPIEFQPGEFAKVALALFFAGYLVDKRELLAMRTRRLGPVMLPDPKHFGPVLLAWGVSLMVMVRQTDLGSSLLFFGLFLVMLWVATERPSFVAIGAVLFAGGAYFAYKSFGHVRDRVNTWLDPYADPQDSGFQVLQASFAMADGGIGGTGLGASGRIDFFAKESDWIFAFLAQDLGLVGATAVIVAFVLIVGAGLRIAVRSDNAFDKLLATGLSTLIGLQAFIIMAGVTRLLPLTGITLPFVSYGGSSLVANYVIVALLLRVSHESAQPVLRPGATASPTMNIPVGSYR